MLKPTAATASIIARTVNISYSHIFLLTDPIIHYSGLLSTSSVTLWKTHYCLGFH
jgi:hypothetical protein